ncbi:carboxypeptidase-like regulatory domain-containing protein [Niabella sp. W65]|nr:carboxypeptidase-like regulatory domain-containing protein [Niabella sp. W65]MCH7364611.1 carboxypeptidase-like regulatory domain-containing protein [Niabella sp. W65]ULT40465.1 carboxypeptidase-like regulatory domain-containing protein [Niabella sp. I65]
MLNIVGRVTDTSGIALSDVTVSVKDTRTGTATNSSGQYSLSGVNENAILVFSYVGYTTQEIPVEGRSRIDVVMRTVEDSLNAVIINVGYGRQRKEFLTSSVSTVSGAELVKAPFPILVPR